MTKLETLIGRLWKTLRPHLRSIGRWVIERISETTGPRIYHYMLERSAFLWEKAKRARKRTRRAALRRRSRRWGRAARWVSGHLEDLTPDVIDGLCVRARSAKIPLTSRLERG